MPPHTFPSSPDVNSYPPDLRRHQTRDPNRVGLVVRSSATTDRDHMMADGQHTTVFLRFTRMLDTYLPYIDGFYRVFPEEKIATISTALKAACAPHAPGRKSTGAEKNVSMAWVSAFVRYAEHIASHFRTTIRGIWMRSTDSARDTR